MMNSYLLQAIGQAVELLWRLDNNLMEIVLLSLGVTGSAMLIATSLGLTIVLALELSSFRGKGVLVALLNTFTGLPPVVVGLVLYLLFSRSGPLGIFNLLYTP